MAEIELWWFPGSCSRVTMVALEQIGDPFTALLSPVARATEPAFLAINPKGKVPVLKTGDVVLTETPAIMTHLADRHPTANLLPRTDPVLALDALATMSWIAGAVHPAITRLRFPQRFCDVPGSQDRTRALAEQALRAAFALVETRLAGREWLYGDWSVLDAYLLWAWFRAIGSGMDSAGLALCAAHAARCELWPSVARALDREEATYAELIASGALPGDRPPHAVGRCSAIPAAAPNRRSS